MSDSKFSQYIVETDQGSLIVKEETLLQSEYFRARISRWDENRKIKILLPDYTNINTFEIVIADLECGKVPKTTREILRSIILKDFLYLPYEKDIALLTPKINPKDYELFLYTITATQYDERLLMILWEYISELSKAKSIEISLSSSVIEQLEVLSRRNSLIIGFHQDRIVSHLVRDNKIIPFREIDICYLKILAITRHGVVLKGNQIYNYLFPGFKKICHTDSKEINISPGLCLGQYARYHEQGKVFISHSNTFVIIIKKWKNLYLHHNGKLLAAFGSNLLDQYDRPDRKYYSVGLGSKSIKKQVISNDMLRKKYSDNIEKYLRITFSPDNRFFVHWIHDWYKIEIYCAENINTPDITFCYLTNDDVSGVSFTSDSKYLAVFSSTLVKIYRTSDYTLRSEYIFPFKEINSVEADPIDHDSIYFSSNGVLYHINISTGNITELVGEKINKFLVILFEI